MLRMRIIAGLRCAVVPGSVVGLFCCGVGQCNVFVVVSGMCCGSFVPRCVCVVVVLFHVMCLLWLLACAAVMLLPVRCLR